MTGQEHKLQHVSQILESREKDSFIFIIELKIKELREDLCETGLSETETAVKRGGVLELRELLDLLK